MSACRWPAANRARQGPADRQRSKQERKEGKASLSFAAPEAAAVAAAAAAAECKRTRKEAYTRRRLNKTSTTKTCG